jgi:hypothetical protein
MGVRFCLDNKASQSMPILQNLQAPGIVPPKSIPEAFYFAPDDSWIRSSLSLLSSSLPFKSLRQATPWHPG